MHIDNLLQIFDDFYDYKTDYKKPNIFGMIFGESDKNINENKKILVSKLKNYIHNDIEEKHAEVLCDILKNFGYKNECVESEYVEPKYREERFKKIEDDIKFLKQKFL